MELKLIRAGKEGAECIWRMQVPAFAGLCQKYPDTETRPRLPGPSEKAAVRLLNPFSHFYLIQTDEETVGVIRAMDKKEPDIPKNLSSASLTPAPKNIFAVDRYPAAIRRRQRAGSNF
jgi:hypothetical protein